MPNWASHAHFSPFSNGLCQIGPLMPTMAHKGGLWIYSKDLLLIWGISRAFLHMSVSLSPVDKWNQANNPRKRNLSLNMRAEDIRVEVPFEPFEEFVCYLLCVNRILILYSLFMPNKTLHIMHTCHTSFWWSVITDIDQNSHQSGKG